MQRLVAVLQGATAALVVPCGKSMKPAVVPVATNEVHGMSCWLELVQSPRAEVGIAAPLNCTILRPTVPFVLVASPPVKAGMAATGRYCEKLSALLVVADRSEEQTSE